MYGSMRIGMEHRMLGEVGVNGITVQLYSQSNPTVVLQSMVTTVNRMIIQRMGTIILRYAHRVTTSSKY